MLRRLAGGLAYGVVTTLGMMLGYDIYNKFKNPVERAKLKKKFKAVK